jgi:hypothetical protein
VALNPQLKRNDEMRKQDQVHEHEEIVDLGAVTEETQGVPLEDAKEGINTRDFYTP